MAPGWALQVAAKASVQDLSVSISPRIMHAQPGEACARIIQVESIDTSNESVTVFESRRERHADI